MLLTKFRKQHLIKVSRAPDLGIAVSCVDFCQRRTACFTLRAQIIFAATVILAPNDGNVARH